MKNANKLIKGCITRDWETLSEAVLWGLFFKKIITLPFSVIKTPCFKIYQCKNECIFKFFFFSFPICLFVLQLLLEVSNTALGLMLYFWGSVRPMINELSFKEKLQQCLKGKPLLLLRYVAPHHCTLNIATWKTSQDVCLNLLCQPSQM